MTCFVIETAISTNPDVTLLKHQCGFFLFVKLKCVEKTGLNINRLYVPPVLRLF